MAQQEQEQDKRPETPEQLAGRMRREAAEQQQRDGMVAALLSERQGYVNRAAAADDEKLAARMADRIAAVDESLRYHGAGDQIPGASKRRGASKTAAPDPAADPSKTA